VGIPLTLLNLNFVGSMMNNGFIKLIKLIESRLLGRKCIKYIKLKCLGCSLVAMVLTFLTGTILIVNITSWSYLNSVYYLFITMSTIGFGDYMISKEHVLDHINKNLQIVIQSLTFIYTLFGLAVVACVINSAVEVTQSFNCATATINDVKPSRSTGAVARQCLKCRSFCLDDQQMSRNIKEEDDLSGVT